MKMYYVTLNSVENAQKISRNLIEKKLAACTNWFSITSMYHWQGDIREENEIVLIIKTKAGMRSKIETVISQYVNYINCIAELPVDSVNTTYLGWLNKEMH